MKFLICRFMHFYHFKWDELMSPLKLPFSVFLAMNEQIENIIADECLSGYALCQSKEGINLLIERKKSVIKKNVFLRGKKEVEEDRKKEFETFKKIRALKYKLGGKLRPVSEEKKNA